MILAVVGTALLLAGAEFALPGLLEVEVSVDRRQMAEQCKLKAYPSDRPKELALDGPAVEPLRLTEGSYRLKVECATAKGRVVSILDRVLVRSEVTTKKRVQIKTGSIVVQTQRDRGRVTADIEVTDPRYNELVATGKSGNRLTVQTGNYQVAVVYQVGDSEPCRSTHKVRVAPGKLARLKLDLSDGTMRISATRNGKKAPGLVALYPLGSSERLLEFATDHEALVPPGSYNAVVTLESSYDFEGKKLRRLKVLPNKLTQRKVAFSMATLRVNCLLHGTEVGARVYLYVPGAPDYFNFADSGQDIDLSPGKYVIRATLDDSVPYDAARPQGWGVTDRVTIRRGARSVANVDFTPGTLVITALKNGKPTPAALTIWLKKPRIRLSGGAAGEPMAIASGTYDVDVLYPNGGSGDLVKISGVRVPTARETKRSVNIERGGLTIDTFDAGKRVDAEVRFYKKNSKAPLLLVRGGETAELPPGAYEIEIALGEKKRWVSAMRVKAGSWEVRRVEF